MAKTDLSIKIGAEYVGKMAFAKAEKSIAKLGKQVAGLALGGGILNFGISSVKAFYDSEKSAKALNGTLTNLNLAFRKNDIKKFIDKLSLATGITNETLNPAFQQLLLTTRNVEKSQKLLGVAMDISATTGESLSSTVDALSKGYLGNTKGLAGMKLGLSKAQLAANNFDDILKYLAITFEGQAAIAAQGFTGDVDKLTVAIDQFKESIGRGIASGISNSNGEIDQTTNALTGLGTALGKLIELNLKVSPLQIFSKSFWRDLVGTSTRGISGMGDGSDRGGASKVQDAKTAAKQKAISDAQLKATKALTKATADTTKLKKAGTLFDTEQANILIALQGKITSNEKLRLELQLALLEGNSKEADRLSNELLLSQGRLTGLATFISNLPKALNPFADYPAYVLAALAEIAKLKAGQDALAVQPNQPASKSLEQARVEAVNGLSTVTSIYNDLMSKIANTNKVSSTPSITINNAGSVVTDAELAESIRLQLINQAGGGNFATLNRNDFRL